MMMMMMMMKGKTSMALAVAVVAMLAVAAAAAPAAGLCKMSQEGLMACKPYISSSPAPTAENPSEACCTALQQADLPCLCGYKNSNMLPYLGIDPKLAMQLPTKCNVPTPQQC